MYAWVDWDPYFEFSSLMLALDLSMYSSNTDKLVECVGLLRWQPLFFIPGDTLRYCMYLLLPEEGQFRPGHAFDVGQPFFLFPVIPI